MKSKCCWTRKRKEEEEDQFIPGESELVPILANHAPPGPTGTVRVPWIEAVIMAADTPTLEMKDIPKIEKLNDKNYRKWSILMEDILVAKGLWQAVTTSLTAIA